MYRRAASWLWSTFTAMVFEFRRKTTTTRILTMSVAIQSSHSCISCIACLHSYNFRFIPFHAFISFMFISFAGACWHSCHPFMRSCIHFVHSFMRSIHVMHWFFSFLSLHSFRSLHPFLHFTHLLSYHSSIHLFPFIRWAQFQNALFSTICAFWNRPHRT